MYTILDYGAMIADKVRMGAFERALREAVKPGSIVADIGTGTGIFALLACRFGARRVYAIEPDDAIQVARESAAANGYADRIEFIQAMSTQVSLPERADVIVSDIGGVLPWFREHIPSIIDARRRFLAPGGVLIPQRDRAWAVVVEAPELYRPYADPWDRNGFDLDMEAARRLALNSWSKGKIGRHQLLTEPRRWATLDYLTVDDPHVRATVQWTVTRAGTGHGLVAGFDRTVLEGIALSNAPDAPDTIRPERIYGTIFFPWASPVPLAEGDLVTGELEARHVGEDYVWSWRTRVEERPGRPGATIKAEFSQSTFLGAPLSPAQLRKRAADYRPTLNEDGRLVRTVLEAMDRGLSLGDVAAELVARFPSRFRGDEDALSYAGELARKYG